MDDWLPRGYAKWRDAITEAGKKIYGAAWTGREHIAGALLAPAIVLEQEAAAISAVLTERAAIREKTAKAKAVQGTILRPGIQNLNKYGRPMRPWPAMPMKSDAATLDALYRADREALNRYQGAAGATQDEIRGGAKTAIIITAGSDLREISTDEWALPAYRQIVLDPRCPLVDEILLKDSAASTSDKPSGAPSQRNARTSHRRHATKGQNTVDALTALYPEGQITDQLKHVHGKVCDWLREHARLTVSVETVRRAMKKRALQNPQT